MPDADVALEVLNGITFLTPVWMLKPHVTLVHHIHRSHYVEELGGREPWRRWRSRHSR